MLAQTKGQYATQTMGMDRSSLGHFAQFFVIVTPLVGGLHLPLVWRYLPAYWRPREDGQQG